MTIVVTNLLEDSQQIAKKYKIKHTLPITQEGDILKKHKNIIKLKTDSKILSELHLLRSVKTNSEINKIKIACQKTGESLLKTIKHIFKHYQKKTKNHYTH